MIISCDVYYVKSLRSDESLKLKLGFDSSSFLFLNEDENDNWENGSLFKLNYRICYNYIFA